MKRIQFKKSLITLGILSSALAHAGAMGPVAAPYSWTGFYVGGNVGGMWGTTNFGGDVVGGGAFGGVVTAAIDANLIGKVTNSSAAGGFQVGYEYTLFDTPWVGSGTEPATTFNRGMIKPIIGVELDMDFADINPARDALTNTTPQGLIHQSDALDWQGTGRVNLGFGSPMWQVYGTGGVIVTKGTTVNDVCFPGATPSHCNLASTNTTHSGGVWGVGGDWRINKQWSVGVLGLWGFPSKETQRSDAVTVDGDILPGSLIVSRTRQETTVATFRVNYHFDSVLGDIG